MAYLNAKSPQESKRVSFLSVFSSLMQSHSQCNAEDIDKFVAEAFRIVDKLWTAIPDPTYTAPVAGETPFPSQGDSKCPKCGKDMKLVPAGFSKTKNKSYGAFYSCDSKAGGCGFTQSLPTGP